MIKLHIMLQGEESLDFVTNGIKGKNKITYRENDIKVSIVKHTNSLRIKRICNDYEINLVFKLNEETKSTYSLFGGQKEFLLNTKTNKLIMNDNLIEIEYDLEGNIFKYILEVI